MERESSSGPLPSIYKLLCCWVEPLERQYWALVSGDHGWPLQGRYIFLAHGGWLFFVLHVLGVVRCGGSTGVGGVSFYAGSSGRWSFVHSSGVGKPTMHPAPRLGSSSTQVQPNLGSYGADMSRSRLEMVSDSGGPV